MKYGMGSIHYDDLICLALRHRWIPRAGEYYIMNGLKAIRWDLSCESGCGCTARDYRDYDGNRISGTQRVYSYTDRYKSSTGYTQAEYITEIHQRLSDARKARLA